MIVRNKILVLVGMLILPFVAMSDVMYWQVDQNVKDKNTKASIDWSYAKLRVTEQPTAEKAIYGDTGGMSITETDASNPIMPVVNSHGDAYYLDEDGNPTADLLDSLYKSDFANGAAVYANVAGDYRTPSYSFYVELYNDAGTLVGFSEAVSSSALASYFAGSVQQGVQWANVNQWNVTNFTAVPEPTSGVMLLLGAALLGLRRRRLA